MIIEKNILKQIKKDPVISQNILMRIPDREIAISISNLEDTDIRYILSLLSNQKSKRIKEEISLQKRLKIDYKTYIKLINKFKSYFDSSGNKNQERSYLKPVK